MGLIGGNPQLDLSPDEIEKQRLERERKQVTFWKSRIKSASELEVYKELRKAKDEAKSFYSGKIFFGTDITNWEGDVVEANLFRRDVNFIINAIYSNNPHIRVTFKEKGSPASAKTIEKHLTYVWDECSLALEVKRAMKDAFFGNLATAKLDFDEDRQLFRAKWVAGEIIIDPDAWGDILRAKFIAEKVKMPRYRIWQNEQFNLKGRTEIQKKFATQSEIDYTNQISKDQSTLWYIFTNEGVEPLKDNKGSRLLVYSEDYDGWLMNIENPCDFLNNDETIYSIMELDELPGDSVGPAPWKLVACIVKAFNWAASYHQSDMRKTAARYIGYDKNKLDDPNILRSRKHMVVVPIDGPVTDEVVKPLNIGAADKTIFESVNFWYNLNNQITGIDDIARGEEGKLKTATESQILQQNSNIALRGYMTAVDEFMNDMIKKIALASLRYIPAFSIFPNPDQMSPIKFLTKQVVQGVDPQTGSQIMVIPAQGAIKPVKGIDYFHSDEDAMNWPQMPYEDIKAEYSFSIEAGSTRADRRLEKQRTSMALLQTIGVEYKNLGAWDQYYEVINQVIQSFELPNSDKLLIPKELFIQLGMQMKQMQMMQGTQAQEGGAEKANPAMFTQNTNPGTPFPLSGRSGKDEGSGR